MSKERKIIALILFGHLFKNALSTESQVECTSQMLEVCFLRCLNVKHVRHCLSRLDWQRLRTPLMRLCMRHRVCYTACKACGQKFFFTSSLNIFRQWAPGRIVLALMIWPDNKTTQKVLEEVFWSLGLITTRHKKIKPPPHLIGSFSFMLL